MSNVQSSEGCRSVAIATTDPARAQVRAVAFRMDGVVYAGQPGETHGTLYLRLLRERVVPTQWLDLWSCHEDDHGFVTDDDEFLNRAEAFRRFGIRRSEELNAAGPPNE